MASGSLDDRDEGWMDVILDEQAKDKLGGQPPTTRASIPPRHRVKDPKRVKAGKRARSSGAVLEREAVRELERLGVLIEKMPLSGRGRAAGRGGDAEIPGLGRVEIRGRAAGFRTLYRWLAPVAMLLVRGKQEQVGEPRPEWIAVIRAKDLGQLIARAQTATGGTWPVATPEDKP